MHPHFKRLSFNYDYYYNDRVSHVEADKTVTDARFNYQYYYSSFDHRNKKSRSAEKMTRQKIKNHNRQKNGLA